MNDGTPRTGRPHGQRKDQTVASEAVARRRAERLATTIGICRLLSLIGALLLWAAWSVASFSVLLGFALSAGLIAVLLARLAVAQGSRIEAACDLDTRAAE